MPKKSSAKKANVKKTSKKPQVKTSWTRRWYEVRKQRMQNFLERRPHRTLRPTAKSSMPLHPVLPGYIPFSMQVFRTIKRFKKPLLRFGLVFMVINLLVIGLAQQENYQFFSNTIKAVGDDLAAGDFGSITSTVTLFGIAVSGGLNGELSDAQQFALGLTTLLLALSVVWFLRHGLQGKVISVRDALYSSGGPILPAVLLTLVATVQMMPAALGALLYTVVSSAGVSGIELMMFAVASVLLILMSLYWVISTFFAGIIVTIPGTYPMRALKLAGDIVIGRRLTLLMRTLWLGLILLITWALILIPILLLAGAINVTWLPLVPVTIQILSAWSLIFSVTYIYLLYRRMLDEPGN